MSFLEKMRHIGAELKGHAPFTFGGAVLGLAFMLVFKDIGRPAAGVMFAIFHPAHVLLSAVVTAAMFKVHARKINFWIVLSVGYFGAVGVATLSDSVIPFFGESILGVAIPLHADTHEHGEHGESAVVHDETCEIDGHKHEHAHETHRPKLHLGFIEEWWAVTPAALLGVLIAWFIPRTRFPHAGHVLISTWASSAHMLMNTEAAFSVTIAVGSVIVLFLAVMLPCCISDIVFPLLFVRSDLELKDSCVCSNHALHSHPHVHEHTDACRGDDAEAS
ncbi:MAG: hypothetical protein IH624_16805 [Phycisphaerae bacterium]|nr:hypothetical protein [Phycisphaerae bacterium]